MNAKKNIEAVYPLSPMQQGMLFHTLYAPEAGMYIEQLRCVLRGELDAAKFEQAWQRVVDRHPVLRTAFVWDGVAEPLQMVGRRVKMPLEQQDWRHLPAPQQAARLEALLQEDKRRGFKLSKAPLMRLVLIRLSDDAHQFIWSHHHLLLDGWSLSLLLKEVFDFYEAFRRGADLTLPVSRPYRDYIAWLQQQSRTRAEAFWREHLKGLTAPTPLRVDGAAAPRPDLKEEYSDEQVWLTEEVTAALQSMARAHQLTLNTPVQGAWGLLLSRYSGETDVMYGAVVSGRPAALAGVETMIGMFINTLPVRLRVREDETLASWLKQVQNQQVELRKYEYSPLVDVQRYSEVARGLPMFESLLLFENYPVDESLNESMSSLRITDFHADDRANYPLSVFVVPGRRLSLRIAYDTGRFKADAIARMLGHFRTLLEAMTGDPSRRLCELPLLTGPEQKQLLVDWNDTREDYPASRRIQDLFEAQVERTPDAIAVSFARHRLTYRELNSRANRLAHYLQSLGVRPESRVAICIGRSAEFLVGALGILKAGGAYVPLDPSYPLERLAVMMEDAEASLLLTQEQLLDDLPTSHAHVICLDSDWDMIARHSGENPLSNAAANNNAYVIYTSGSTGKPKGVAVTHRSLVNSTAARINYYGEPVKRFLLLPSFAFDSSLAGIFWTLCYGGALVIPEGGREYDPPYLMSLVAENDVSHMLTAPSFYGELVDGFGAEPGAFIKTVIVAGEPCPARLVERHRKAVPQGSLFNEYGPTESTVWSTVFDCRSADPDGQVPIGRPIDNTRIHLLDARLRLVPAGVPGELYISGEGLARGYLHRPELTAASFIPDPYGGRPGSRMYKTGDVARYLPDGNIEFLGRADNQVKIRGYRIELGEVEKALGRHPAIREVVVTAREDAPGVKRMVGYLVANAGHRVTTSELHKFLKDQLPDYMVPSAFVTLDALPLTPNGKVDRKALPAPDEKRPELEESFVAPRNPVERALAQIWGEVLGVKQVGIRDNFFELGGDSIISVQVLSKAQEKGLNFTLQQLFQHRTIYNLAREIQATEAVPETVAHAAPFSLISAKDRAALPDDVEDAYPLTTLQMGLIFHSELRPDTAIYHSIHSFHLRGPLNVEALQAVMQHLAASHPVLRTSYKLSGFEEPLQLVHRGVSFPIEVEDLRHVPADEQAAVLTEWLQGEKLRHFDYNRPPLLRFHIHRRSDDTFQFTFTAHHSIFDGWSDSLFLTELFKGYLSVLKGAELQPAQKSLIPFSEYVALERAAARSGEDKRYWDRKLEGGSITSLPRWPFTQERVDATEFRAFAVPISDELSERLKGLALLTGAPIKSVLLAAHLRVVSLLYGQPDVITGLVSNGRPEAADAERMIGLFVNTLPFRLELKRGTWADLIQQTFEGERELLPHRRYPLAKIQKEHGGRPLFETCFNFTHFHIYQSIQGLAGLELIENTSVGETNFILLANFNVNAVSSKIGLQISCNAAELSAEQLRAIGGYYAHTLEAMAGRPDELYSLRSVIPEQELREMLVTWNQTRAHYPRESCVHELFEAQVERTPDELAVAYEDDELSFRELNEKANQLARHLLKLGVGPDVPVAICMERSVEMIVGIIGVLKAGGAFVPLSPTYPQERLRFLLEDTATPVLLTQERLLSSLPDHDAAIVCLDVLGWEEIAKESGENLGGRATPDNLAYIIYTSGSTGKPKGVMIQHRSVANLSVGLYESIYSDFGSPLRVSVNAQLVFDASVKQIIQLLSGHAIVLVPEEVRLDGEAMLSYMDKKRVDVLDCTPSQLKMLLSSGMSERPGAGPRLALVGGEAIDESLWAVLGGDRKTDFYNVYGPTECTVDVAVRRVDASAAQPIIGRPIANVEVYILDAGLNPVPAGVPGELCVSGAGLARGYLNQPALTAEKFVPNPFSGEPGARLYKTGDMARYLPGGDIQYVGRIDYQVKVRGYRIEPGEVEAALAEHNHVAGAVVMAREDAPGDARLVGYVAPRPGRETTAAELQGFLKKRLPDYMIPTSFVILDAFPLTLNGKVNRRALPAPEEVRAERDSSFIAPRTLIEEVLAGTWCELFGLERVGVNDNFFDLGGHSLLATQAVAWASEVFGVKIPLRTLFDSPTLEGLAAFIEKGVKTGGHFHAPPIARVPRDRALPLSFAQQRLWFLDQFEPGLSVYNIPAALRLVGELDVEALEKSINEIIERHESLRTVFVSEEGLPYQVIAGQAHFDLPVIDLANGMGEDPKEAARRMAREEARQPFDLARGPLLRVKLLRLSPREHVLLLTMHHIISDGWSIRLLVGEVGALYQGFATGRDVALEELPIQYADYAVWQREFLQGEALEEQLQYWRRQLSGAPAVCELPADRPRPAVHSFEGAIEIFDVGAETTGALSALSRQEGATLFITLLAAFKALLYRYTDQEDIVVGTPIAGRTRREIENLVGFFVNTLVLRTVVSGNLPFRDLLGRVREVALGAYAHQDLPFEKLVEEIQPERDASYTPLFQTMFALQDARSSALELSGLKVADMEVDSGAAKFDLSLTMAETDGRLRGVVDYNTGLFDASTIRRIIDHFKVLLQGVAADADTRLRALPLLTGAEREQILNVWNATRESYPGELCIHQYFEIQAGRTPDNIAAVFEGDALTYSELNLRANQLAHYLRSLGVGPEALVGIYLDRSLEMIVAILGVLKAGGAYLPLDPDYPKERLRFMLEDARTPVLLTQGNMLGDLGEFDGRTVLMDADRREIAEQSRQNPSSGASPDNLAYVIYTSGSTGRPKGAMNSHRGIRNRQLWMQQTYPLAQDDRVLQLSSYSFDFSVWEFFAPLSYGAQLVLLRPGGHRDSAHLVSLIVEKGVTVVHFVPSMLQAFLQEEGVENCATLRHVFCGGESLSPELRDEFFIHLNAALHNQYGPTEASIDVTFWNCERESGQAAVPIGRPNANNQVYILDSHMNLVPAGVPGELYIGGVAVGRGYLNRPELTAEKFIPDPFSQEPGSRLYRTGDLGRYLKDGGIEFLNRIDDQVKIRGFRVELGEIEVSLARHPAVKDALVVMREDSPGDKRLVAYVIPTCERAATAGEMRDFLKKQLPEYMIPSTFVSLDSFPLMPSGKVDRRALPAPAAGDRRRAASERAFGKPRTEVEELLATIWEQLVGVEGVEMHDNFFDLGGHSLMVTRLVSRIRQVFHASIPIRSVFEAPTLSAMAEVIERAMKAGQSAKDLPILPVPRGGKYPLSFAQQRLWFMDQMEPGVWLYNIPAAVRLKGVLDVGSLEAAINEIIKRHESLRTSFESGREGPVQSILESAEIRIAVRNLEGVPPEDRETAAELIAEDEAKEPFDLRHAPLLRASLLKLDREDHILMLTMHHIISDGWSMGLIVKQLGEVYLALTQGENPPPFSQGLQYLDYAVWQRGWLQGEELEKQLAYWKRQLEGAPATLELPADKPRPAAPTYRVAIKAVEIPRDLSDSLKALSRQEGVTLFMTLLAAYKTLLYRWSDQEDILVGSAIANRNRAEVEDIVGFFVNMFVLRTDMSGNPTFRELLGRVRDVTLEAYAHQDLPFDKLIEELRPERALNHSPLFQTVFALQNAPLEPLELPGLTMSALDVYSGTSPFDLTFTIAETRNGLAGLMGYHTELYGDATVSRMLNHYETLLEEIAANPERHLLDIPLEKGEKKEPGEMASDLKRVYEVEQFSF